MSDWPVGVVRDVAVPKGLIGGPFGSRLGSKDYVPHGVPVIRGGNLATPGFFDRSEFVYVTRAKAAGELARNLARPGDVIFTQRGTLGQVGIVPAGPHDTYVVSQSQMRLRVDPGRADPRYIYYQFRSTTMQAAIQNSAITTGVPHINLGILAALPIVIPPLPAQRAVADLLTSLDEKIAGNDRIAATAMALAGAAFEPAAGRPGRLGDLVDLVYGKALPAAQRRPGPVPVYGSGGPAGSHDVPLVSGPGIIVGRKGTVGAVHWSAGDFFPIDTTFYLKPRTIPMEYAYLLLRTLGLSGMNSDSAVPGLNRARALAVPVRAPTKRAIDDFTARARPLFALRDRLARENEALHALRDDLLPGLIEGRIAVATDI
ncbi:restriction endonuclease subunit S [Actinoplanes sp. NPDC026619]|uniref:restriction endonuclease subunit S n=1 Tax=Actinoplanes sp. NPDC026619 TaxID=3155798 RepID=UPI0033E2CBFC